MVKDSFMLGGGMKGVVFTIFLDMVDHSFGPETTEEIIAASDLPSAGAYTTVGTYDHAEIVALVTHLSKATKIAIPDLIRTFGAHLLGEFYRLYPLFFEETEDVLSFLEMVDGYIHTEVLKLYPDATLPKITTRRRGDGELEVIYRSDRMMGDLAEGLIKGAIDHFGEDHVLQRDDVTAQGGGQCVHFKVSRRSKLAA